MPILPEKSQALRELIRSEEPLSGLQAFKAEGERYSLYIAIDRALETGDLEELMKVRESSAAIQSLS